MQAVTYYNVSKKQTSDMKQRYCFHKTQSERTSASDCKRSRDVDSTTITTCCTIQDIYIICIRGMTMYGNYVISFVSGRIIHSPVCINSYRLSVVSTLIHCKIKVRNSDIYKHTLLTNIFNCKLVFINPNDLKRKGM